MSKNVRSRVTLMAQARALMETASGCLYSSGELAAVAATIAIDGQLSTDVQALLAEPGVASLAAGAGLASRLDGLLQSAQGVPGSESRLLPEATQLLADLGQHVGYLERKVVTSLAVDVLRGDGWQVAVEAGEQADGIEAWMDDDLYLLAVTDGGQVVADQAGTGNCGEHQASFEASMAERGATMTRIGGEDHGPQTGPLIARAAATGEPSLAAGIARHAASSSGGPTVQPQKRSTKSSRATKIIIGRRSY